jgi:hypothetical protein
MPKENIIPYIIYGVILVAFYIVLKSPKKKDDSEE